MYNRTMVIDCYLRLVTPHDQPIPVDDGSGLDLPSDIEMALYVMTDMLDLTERIEGIDPDDNPYREAASALAQFVYDVGTGTVLKRCARILGVEEDDLHMALAQCPHYVAAIFGPPREPAPQPGAEDLARKFHETYERLAPSFGYETREASAKPWEEVPEQNRNLMTAVCRELLTPESENPAPRTNPDYLITSTPEGNHHASYRTRSRDREMAKILGNLDRCQHGRHIGDPCAGYDPSRPRSGCAGGYSNGNPFLVPGQPIGYDMYGGVYVVPAFGESVMDPASWVSSTMPLGYEHPDDDPERRIGRDGCLMSRAREHLKLCPVHDTDVSPSPGECVCGDRGDYRSVILALAQELERAKRGGGQVQVNWLNDDLFEVLVDSRRLYTGSYDGLGRAGMADMIKVVQLVAQKLGARFEVHGGAGV